MSSSPSGACSNCASISAASWFRRDRPRPAGRPRGSRCGRQGRGDQAHRREPRSPALHRQVVLGADRRREASPFPSPLLQRRSPGTVGCACSTAAGTGGSSSSVSRTTPPRNSGSGRTRRSSASSERSCVEGVILVKFWLHISDEEQLAPIPGPRGRTAEALETHRRGLAQPRQEPRLRRCRRGRVRPHRSRARSLGRDRRRAEALRPGCRRRTAQRTDRSRNATVGCRSARPRTDLRGGVGAGREGVVAGCVMGRRRSGVPGVTRRGVLFRGPGGCEPGEGCCPAAGIAIATVSMVRRAGSRE